MDARLVILVFVCLFVATVQSFGYSQWNRPPFRHYHHHRYGFRPGYGRPFPGPGYGRPFPRPWHRRPIRLSKATCRLLRSIGVWRMARRSRLFYCPRYIIPTVLPTRPLSTATVPVVTTWTPSTAATSSATMPLGSTIRTNATTTTTTTAAATATTKATTTTNATTTTKATTTKAATTKATTTAKATTTRYTEPTPATKKATAKKATKDSDEKMNNDDVMDQDNDAILQEFIEMLKEARDEENGKAADDVDKSDDVTDVEDIGDDLTNKDVWEDELRHIKDLLNKIE